MEQGLLVFAVVMACLAAASVIYCGVASMSEAWDISHRGWTRGHRQHHVHHRV